MSDLPKTREFPRAADAFGYQPVTEDRDELLSRIAELEALLEASNGAISTLEAIAEQRFARLAELGAKVVEQMNFSAEQYDHGVRDGYGLAETALAERDRMLLLMVGEYRRVADVDLIIDDEMVLADLRARAEEGSET